MKKLADIINEIPLRGLAVILVLVLGSLAIFPTVWFEGTFAGICVGTGLFVLAWLTRRLWLPDAYASSTVRNGALTLVSTAALSYGVWAKPVNDMAEGKAWPLLKEQAARFATTENWLGQLAKHVPEHLPSYPAPSLVFLLLLAGSWLVLKACGSNQPMGEHSDSWKKHFPERDFDDRLAKLTGLLRRFLDRIDQDTNWSEHWFTPLDAEVTVSSEGRSRKVRNLLKALRNSHGARTFIVLGDPGSGKSVALRKLSSDLLADVPRTRKIPIYVNLREWNCPAEWTEDNPPNIQQVTTNLQEFIRHHVEDQLDVFAAKFWQDYFERLCQAGRLFFILDSFDEIALLLDHAEGTRLLESMGAGIHAFLHGDHDSRGILSSRLFRRPPAAAFPADLTLEIRPLTPAQVAELFQKRLRPDITTVKQQFAARPDLTLAATNPFTAALLAEYINNAHGQGEAALVPENRVQLYSGYIEGRLKQSEPRFKKLSITAQAAKAVANELATYMFQQSTTGLEASASAFYGKCTIPSPEKIIDGLCYARLLRGSGALSGTVSFVHRRFAEFFMVDHLLAHPEKVNPAVIFTDSRWREVLVLYCEVAPDEQLSGIIDACSQEFQKAAAGKVELASEGWRRVVLALRFLVDGFRKRASCLQERAPGISTSIKALACDEEADLLRRKLATEATDLLTQSDATEVMTVALKSGSPWLAEVAFASCRRSTAWTDPLVSAINEWLFRLRDRDLWRLHRVWSRSLDSGLGTERAFRMTRGYFLESVVWFGGFICLLGLMNTGWGLLLLMVAAVALIDVNGIAMPMGASGRARVYFLSVMVGMSTLWVILFVVLPWGRSILMHKDPGFTQPSFFWPSFRFDATPASALLLAGCMLIPFYSLFAGPRAERLKKCLVMLRHMKTQVFMWRYNLLLWVALILFEWMGQFFPVLKTVMNWFGVVILCFAALAVLYLFLQWFPRGIRYVRNEIQDWLAFQHAGPAGLLTRVQLLEHLHAFKTVRFRLLFLRRLLASSVRPKGEWPSGKFPTRMGTEVTELLMRLEERWLGIDR